MEQAKKREVPWKMFLPILWAPFLYTIRHALKGRVSLRTQHLTFGAGILFAGVHGGTSFFHFISFQATPSFNLSFHLIS
jgi:hypothetical protein